LFGVELTLASLYPSFFCDCLFSNLFSLRIKEQEFETRWQNHQNKQESATFSPSKVQTTIIILKLSTNKKVSLPFCPLLQELLVQHKQERIGDEDRSL